MFAQFASRCCGAINPLSEEKISNRDPVVEGPPTTYAGTCKFGVRPQRMKQHNLVSWKIVEAILDPCGTADFRDLAVAVRGHKYGTKGVKGPQHFVSYCIKMGWLVRA